MGATEKISGDFSYFALNEAGDIRAYYEANGYVVIRGLVSPDACDRVRVLFDEEVRPYPGPLYRQGGPPVCRHVWNEHGQMMNALLNVQSLPPSLGKFRAAALDILTGTDVQDAARVLLLDKPKLVQSMYFEANAATQAHQDPYYLDAERLGGMAAGWFALEDIAKEAGRFYVCPGSQKIDIAQNSGDFDIAFNHARYTDLVRRIIADNRLELRAPALSKGDVLFWNSRTIHGALPTQDPRRSRISMTAHYIPDASRFLQYQSRNKPLYLGTVNGMRVHRPKDLSRPWHRVILWCSSTFPKQVRFVRRLAIKALTR